MGVALYIVAEREIPGFDPTVSAPTLGRSDDLDALAGFAGVPPLMSFFFPDQGEVDFVSELSGDKLPDLPPAQWFPARDGLATVRRMLSYLTLGLTTIPNASAIAAD